MKKRCIARRIEIAVMLCSAVATVLCLIYHRAVPATLLGLLFFAASYRLTQLVEADFGPQERWRKKAQMEALLAEGPVGVWAQILGPKGVKALLLVGVVALVVHLIVDLVVGL